MNEEFQEISSDQLIVRVWKACNFKCNFCNVSTNESHVNIKESVKDIVRNFLYKFKYSSVKERWMLMVTISGWEPSLFKKETIFSLKYIKKFLEDRNIKYEFNIQTNASLIDDKFAKELYENWVTSALVSFHMIDEKIFEKVIQIPYKNFYKIIDGINSLNKVWIEVSTNTIMSNENKNNFFETVKFIKNTFPFINIFNIWMIQPHWEAFKIIEKVFPKYNEVYYDYNKTIFFLKNFWKNIESHFFSPPACYMNTLKYSLENRDNLLFRKNSNFSEKYLLNNINDKNKTQTKDCEKCLYNNICSGIWKEYVWLQKLKPVNYVIDKNNNFEKNNFAYKLKNKNENLKKIYDWNFRQIIIKTSLWNEVEIYELLKNATKIWFYKISLLLDSDFEIKKDIVYTGVSNIQLKKEQISNEVLYFIKDFSTKYSPQFRIDIDFI